MLSPAAGRRIPGISGLYGTLPDGRSPIHEELDKLGYVFNFITYGGHQVDGMLAPLTNLSRLIEDSANDAVVC